MLSRNLKANFGHMYRLSKGGYFHFVVLAINFGSDGATLVLFNLFVTIGLVKQSK